MVIGGGGGGGVEGVEVELNELRKQQNYKINIFLLKIYYATTIATCLSDVLVSINYFKHAPCGRKEHGL